VQAAGFEAAVAFVIGLAESESARTCNSLGLGLLSSLAKDALDQTVAVSPAGLVAALALLAPGARGAAGKALTTELGHDPDSFGRMLRDAAFSSSTGKAAVLMASALWPSTRLTLQGDYLARMQDQDGTEIRPIDFAGTDAAATINSWVSEHTRGLIRHVTDRLPADTIAAITSAVYFKAAWDIAFNPALTQPGTFERGQAARLTVPMMQREGTFAYCEGSSFQAVCLHFAGDAWQALVVVDRDEEAAMANPSAFAARKGKLIMPRLSFKTAAELTGPLQENGLADVISRDADFSGIADQAFHVSAIRQSIAMNADETGAEAAAATIAKFRPRIMLPAELRPFTMLVNRPFLFAIRHRVTGLLLFAAKVCDPGTT
jgi:serpin B